MSLASDIFAGFADTEAIRQVSITRRDGSDILNGVQAFKTNVSQPGKLSAKGNIRAHKELEGSFTRFLIDVIEINQYYTETTPPLTHDKIFDELNNIEYGIIAVEPTSAGSWRIDCVTEVTTRRRASR